MKGCSIEDLLIEMDRILRPKGFIIIQDELHIIDYVKKYIKALHWEAIRESDRNEAGSVLVIQKKMWLTSQSVRSSE